jgi:hypothetical protein
MLVSSIIIATPLVRHAELSDLQRIVLYNLFYLVFHVFLIMREPEVILAVHGVGSLFVDVLRGSEETRSRASFDQVWVLTNTGKFELHRIFRDEKKLVDLLTYGSGEIQEPEGGIM